MQQHHLQEIMDMSRQMSMQTAQGRGLLDRRGSDLVVNNVPYPQQQRPPPERTFSNNPSPSFHASPILNPAITTSPMMYSASSSPQAFPAAHDPINTSANTLNMHPVTPLVPNIPSPISRESISQMARQIASNGQTGMNQQQQQQQQQQQSHAVTNSQYQNRATSLDIGSGSGQVRRVGDLRGWNGRDIEVGIANVNGIGSGNWVGVGGGSTLHAGVQHGVQQRGGSIGLPVVQGMTSAPNSAGLGRPASLGGRGGSIHGSPAMNQLGRGAGRGGDVGVGAAAGVESTMSPGIAAMMEQARQGTGQGMGSERTLSRSTSGPAAIGLGIGNGNNITMSPSPFAPQNSLHDQQAALQRRTSGTQPQPQRGSPQQSQPQPIYQSPPQNPAPSHPVHMQHPPSNHAQQQQQVPPSQQVFVQKSSAEQSSSAGQRFPAGQSSPENAAVAVVVPTLVTRLAPSKLTIEQLWTNISSDATASHAREMEAQRALLEAKEAISTTTIQFNELQSLYQQTQSLYQQSQQHLDQMQKHLDARATGDQDLAKAKAAFEAQLQRNKDDQNAQLQREKEDRKVQEEAMEKSVKDALQTARNAETEKNKMEKELEKVRATETKMKSAESEMSARLEGLQARADRVEKLEQLLVTAQSDEAKARKELEDGVQLVGTTMTEQSTLFRSQIDKLVDERKQLLSEKEALQAKLTEETKEKERVKAELKQRDGASIREMKIDLDSLEGRLKNRDDTIRDLRLNLDRIESEKEAGWKAAETATIRNLNKMVNWHKEEVSRLTALNNQLRMENVAVAAAPLGSLNPAGIVKDTPPTSSGKTAPVPSLGIGSSSNVARAPSQLQKSTGAPPLAHTIQSPSPSDRGGTVQVKDTAIKSASPIVAVLVAPPSSNKLTTPARGTTPLAVAKPSQAVQGKEQGSELSSIRGSKRNAQDDAESRPAKKVAASPTIATTNSTLTSAERDLIAARHQSIIEPKTKLCRLCTKNKVTIDSAKEMMIHVEKEHEPAIRKILEGFQKNLQEKVQVKAESRPSS